jgi:LuxR family maltose regulon positive regulatory protein
VVAPAGTGKTSLLSGWASEARVLTAWLTLDETDRDATQLWSGVIAVLEPLKPGCGARTLGLLQRHAPLPDAIRVLLDDLDNRPDSPVVLVIDNVHTIDGDPALVASLARFVEHLPVWLHVVLISRRPPQLPLDRLRARGHVGEISFAELRFSEDEARELLIRLAPRMSGEAIDVAGVRADGWATSLQMAAIASRSSRAKVDADAPPNTDGLLVDDYLWREVFKGEPTELVAALIDVAVVERVDANLAQALTGRSDARELLLEAEGRGLFVTRLDPDGWFEVHSLARAALVAELTRSSPERVREQHTRAARWFEDAGDVALALDHWLAAGEPRRALRLLSLRHAQLYDTGREAVIRRVIAALPPGTAGADVESMLEFAWCHLLLDRHRFLELVDQATWWAGRATTSDTARTHLTMLQSFAATIRGCWSDGGVLARQAMTEMGDASWRDHLGRFGWNMVARDIALSERWSDSSDEVREAELGLSRDPERRLTFEGTRALGHALAGRPLEALRIAAGVRPAASVANMTILRTELALGEAMAHRELGDRTRARAELAALADRPADSVLYCRVLAGCELALLHVDDSDLESARRTFEAAGALVEAESFGAGVRAWLARVGTLVALATDVAAEARHWSEQIDDPFWGPVSTARTELSEGNLIEALRALDTASPRSPRQNVTLALLEARCLGRRDEAEKRATAGFELAAAHGLVQTVASEADHISDLLEAAAWRVPRLWLDRVRRAAIAGSAGLVPGRQVAELTQRERDVLRFLPSRLTLREIAAELYISANTLKFHLKVIYQKLGVNSRAEAAEIARRLTSTPRR